ncbi:hypothetical protein I0P70_13640 [Pontibacter sp. FD36]|uniref:putative phage abortive infection protein n=1 Tax=Pontibacter sp. FD36 TaxID=2789860 RepID=UPI0018A8F01B|nr:putative phage abortive infection protein [Pontibacter sp. FD36]MBF8964292.1 hypothetical protein [Pontibacter sp. FD36]
MSKEESFWETTRREYGRFGSGLLIASAVSVAIGLLITGVFIYNLNGSLEFGTPVTEKDFSANGIIGDFIGGVVGSLLSFVGVILFFLALRLQTNELALQRKELADTRDVFSTQQFENTFFNLLKTQQDIRLNIEVDHNKVLVEYQPNSQPHYKSGTAFIYLKNVITNFYNFLVTSLNKLDNLEKKDNLTPAELIEKNTLKEEIVKLTEINDLKILDTPENIAKASYRYVYLLYSNQLGHYFRNLYHILLYLEENEIREFRTAFNDSTGAYKDFTEGDIRGIFKAKYKRYADFVQAQMNSTELFLLFYNSLFFPKMKRLLYHFDFLENLNSDDLLDPDNDKLFYNDLEVNGEIEYYAIKLKSKIEMLRL